MQELLLALSFVLSGLLWGTILGAGLGFLFNLVVFGFATYGIFGTIIGGLTGCIVGVLNGVGIAFVTLRSFYPLDDPRTYRNTIQQTSGWLTLAGSFLLFFLVLSWLFHSEWFGLVIGLIAAFVATVAARFIATREANWYIRQYQDPMALPSDEDSVEADTLESGNDTH